jgi:hypothetical protein
MRKIAALLVIASASVPASARADVCIVSGFSPAAGTVCVGTPDGSATIRVAPSILSVSFSAAGVSLGETGVAVAYDTPPRVRVLLNGSTHEPLPPPYRSNEPSTVCVASYTSAPNGIGNGRACWEGSGLPGDVSVLSKSLWFSVTYVDHGEDGEPLGDTTIEMNYGRTPAAVRVVVDGAVLYQS